MTSYLADFLFPTQRAKSPVKMLSGGERNRLLLARLFARPANFIVLDEPTNDLDIESLELLEQKLQEYPGTLLLVSHDRQVSRQCRDQTMAAEGDGRWRDYVGGYSGLVDAEAQGAVRLPAERAEACCSASGGSRESRARDSATRISVSWKRYPVRLKRSSVSRASSMRG